MTEGTSQGLFIVVAIVIFGIFVVLAYILFEDTLSPALASMFTEATEKTERALNSQYTDERFFVFDTDTQQILDYRDFDMEDGISLPTDVRIPRRIQGVEVKIIGGRAFDNKGLTSVQIPNTVTHIEDGNNPLGADYWGAFSKNKLKEVVIPDSVVFFGYGAFWGNELESIKLSKNIHYTGHTALTGNKFKTFDIPKHITEIGAYTFHGNPLETIHIPENVTHIGKYVFTKTNLKELTIPNTVISFQEYIIYDAEFLETVTLPIRFKSVVLGNKNYLGLDAYGTQPKTIHFTDEDGNIVETIKN